MTELLSRLIEVDTDLLLAINGLRAEWANYFMYAFSGKLVWIPMYAAILYLIFRNFHWKVALGCVVAVALTIVFADQVCATFIRPYVCRLRPSNLENPVSEFIQIVNGYRGGKYGFPSCHAANTFGLAFFLFFLFRNRMLTLFIMVWAAMTCYSRSYLGVHYPGDLLVGAIVGGVGAWICYRVFICLFRYERSDKLRHAYVPMLVGGVTMLIILIYAGVSALM